jgi:CHAT domain-containing protein
MRLQPGLQLAEPGRWCHLDAADRGRFVRKPGATRAARDPPVASHPVRREEWFDQLCRNTVAMLPTKHQPFLSAVPNLDVPGAPGDSAAVGKAALLAEILGGYTTALSANELTQKLIASNLCPPGASPQELLDELVRPVFQALRLGRLPLAEWWSPETLHLLVFTWYARWRIAEAGEGSAREELRQRWGRSPEAIDVTVDEALLPEPIIPAVLDDRPDAPLASVWARPEIADAVRDQATRLPETLRLHDELWAIGMATARYRTLGAKRAQVAPLLADGEVDALIEEAGAELRTNVLRFTPYEVGRMRELDDDERLLRASVDALRNVAHVSSAGANAPADGYLDGLLVPDWLTEYVVSAGGRIGHRSCGPIPYWFAVLELADLPDEVLTGDAQARIGVAELETEVGLVEYAVQLHFRGEERVAQFHFADAVGQAMQLALIALAGFVRIDFFFLRSDGLLELIHSARYGIEDSPMRASARGVAVAALRPHGENADTLLNAWFREHDADQGVPGFIASDWAKAEELLGIGRLQLSATSEESPPARFNDARDHWLTASDELARRRLVTVDTDDLITSTDAALADYRLALGDLHPPPHHADESTRLRALVAGLVDSQHAFLHLNRSQDYLEAFICIGDADGPSAERLEVSSTPLSAIESALAAWRDGEPSSLTRVLDAVGPGLGQAIADAIEPRGVSHVFVSPVGFLNALPFCALPQADGRYLGDLVSISYAPSARVLQRLRDQRASEAARVIALAFHEDGDIPLSSGEVGAIGALYENVVTLTGDTATADALIAAAGDARIVHLACHGTWRLGDTYGSGLHLAGSTAPDGYLSVARLYRDADLSGVRVAVLSACDTGRAATRWPQVESYTGIDGAFLACGAQSVVSSLWEVDDLAGLLFSVAFHEALASDATILDAFTSGVEVLRSGRYQHLDGSDTAKVLDASAPTWREDLSELGPALMDPYYWAVFKLAGLL